MIWENRIKITVFTDVIHHIYKKLPFIEDRCYTFLLYIFCIFVPLQLLSYNPNSSKCVSILGQYSKIEKQYLEGALSVKFFLVRDENQDRKSRELEARKCGLEYKRWWAPSKFLCTRIYLLNQILVSECSWHSDLILFMPHEAGVAGGSHNIFSIQNWALFQVNTRTY